MSGRKNIRQEFADTMVELGNKDKNLVVMVGDISHGKLKEFAKKFKDRYINVGILEPTMIGMGAGFSKVGINPVLHTISPFIIERSFEQIKLDFCYHKLPGNIITVGGAFDYSNLGCSHHCYGDFSLMKTLPHVNIFNPSSAIEFNELFKQNYRSKKLNYFRLSGNDHEYTFKKSQIKSGQPIKILNGKNLSILAVGSQLKNCLKVARLLQKIKIETDLYYIHSIRPLDLKDIVKSAKKTNKVVVVEEHITSGGLSEDIIKNTYQIKNLKFLQVCIDNFITSYGSYDDLCEAAGIDCKSILKKIKKFIK
jgi:transketolase